MFHDYACFMRERGKKKYIDGEIWREMGSDKGAMERQ